MPGRRDRILRTMKLQLIAVGRRLPLWAREGFEHYRRMLHPQLQLQLLEIAHARGGTAQQQKKREGDLILRALPHQSHVVALDEHGRQLDSAELAAELEHWQGLGREVVMVIGGPDGLDGACLARADQVVALSRLTLPHALVRVLTAEALYRAWSMVQGLPYHRA